MLQTTQQIEYQIIKSTTKDFTKFTLVDLPYENLTNAITSADHYQWKSDYDDYGNIFGAMYRVIEKDSNEIVYQTISKTPYDIFRYSTDDIYSRTVRNTDGSLSPQVYVNKKWYYLATKEKRYITANTLLECEEAIQEHYKEAKPLLR